jgi:hypothetical protein
MRQPPPVTPFRLRTSQLRVLPDFFVLGEMRSGTSSLHSYLQEHPQILRPFIKEVHFFDRRYTKGIAWYRAHFPTRTAILWHALRHGRALTYEATPDYLSYPDVARRLWKVRPGAKLIALLRNPVDRAYSHYQFNVRIQRERHSFSKAIRKEAERLEGEREKVLSDESYLSQRLRRYTYASRGTYVDSLLAYERYFPRDQMLVIKSEDLFDRTQDTYQQILDFLGLRYWTLRNPVSVNTAAYSRDKPQGYDELRAFFAPYNQRLYEYLGRDLGW